MSARFGAINLAQYPVSDILEPLDFEALLAAAIEEFDTRWAALRTANPELPEIDVLGLSQDPLRIDFEVGAYRELLTRALVNFKARQLTLAGATGRYLDHIAATYFRGVTRRVITEAAGGTPAVLEDDESFRQRTALSVESWSTCGPEGAYVFYGLSASSDVLDVAAYSEDEGVCLAPQIRMVVLGRSTMTQTPTQLNATVKAALDRIERRPMGDLVTVETAAQLPFNVNVTLRVRPGASPAVVAEAARARIVAYCQGRLRWAGQDVTGPQWLIGRTLRREMIAAVASGGDENIVDVILNQPTADVNAPDAGYTEAALVGVGEPDFEPLAEEVTAHLRTAPMLGTVTITTETAATGIWS